MYLQSIVHIRCILNPKFALEINNLSKSFGYGHLQKIID